MVDPLCFGVVWQLGAQEILCEWNEEWIQPNTNKLLRLFKGQSKHWSLKSLGIPARQSTQAYLKYDGVPPGKTDEGFGMATTWLLLKICGEISKIEK